MEFTSANPKIDTISVEWHCQSGSGKVYRILPKERDYDRMRTLKYDSNLNVSSSSFQFAWYLYFWVLWLISCCCYCRIHRLINEKREKRSGQVKIPFLICLVTSAKDQSNESDFGEVVIIEERPALPKKSTIQIPSMDGESLESSIYSYRHEP